MTLQQVLDQYCLARAMARRDEQIGYGNALVDEHIPALIQRLSETIIERNAARDENERIRASS